MKKILIIGGGLAGLSAAINLIEEGYKIEIIEASPKLGGRTYSFLSNDKHTIIDNGQHILMGCYSHTLDYIDRVNSRDKFEALCRIIDVEPDFYGLIFCKTKLEVAMIADRLNKR